MIISKLKMFSAMKDLSSSAKLKSSALIIQIIFWGELSLNTRFSRNSIEKLGLNHNYFGSSCFLCAEIAFNYLTWVCLEFPHKASIFRDIYFCYRIYLKMMK